MEVIFPLLLLFFYMQYMRIYLHVNCMPVTFCVHILRLWLNSFIRILLYSYQMVDSTHTQWEKLVTGEMHSI